MRPRGEDRPRDTGTPMPLSVSDGENMPMRGMWLRVSFALNLLSLAVGVSVHGFADEIRIDLPASIRAQSDVGKRRDAGQDTNGPNVSRGRVRRGWMDDLLRPSIPVHRYSPEMLDLNRNGLIDDGDLLLLRARVGDSYIDPAWGQRIPSPFDLIENAVTDEADVHLLESYLGTDVIAALVAEIERTVTQLGGAFTGDYLLAHKADRALHEMETRFRQNPHYAELERLRSVLVAYDDLARAPLLRLASHRNPFVRKQALLALGELGGEAAKERLLSVFDDATESAYIREAAARGLISMTDVREAIIGRLIGIVQDHDEYRPFREGMARVLGSSNDVRAIAALQTVAHDVAEPPHFRIAIIEALGLSTARAAIDGLIGLLVDAGNTESFPALAAETTLKAMLRNEEMADAVLERLIASLDSPEEQRVLAVWAILSSTRADAEPRLIEALESESAQVRWMATRVLGARLDERAIEPLIGRLADDDAEVRRAARDALVALGQECDDTLAALRSALVDTTTPEQQEPIREGAKQAFVRIRRPEVLTYVVPLLSYQNSKARNAAAMILGTRQADVAVAPLRRAYRDRLPSKNAIMAALAMVLSRAEASFWSSERYDAEVTLLGIGTDAVRKIVAIQKAKEQDPIILGALDDASRWLDRQDDVRSRVPAYGVALKGKFSLQGLENILRVFESLPRELWSPLNGFRLVDEIPNLPGAEGLYLPETNDVMLATHGQLQIGVILHEIAHLIDENFLGFTAFTELYSRSRVARDFAREHGRSDAKEDFATTFEAYIEDSVAEIGRAIRRARQTTGSTVYLEKLLRIIDVLAGDFRGEQPFGRTSYAFLVDQAADTIERVPLGLDRDGAGRLVSIDGVPIRTEAGTFNLDGIADLFEGLAGQGFAPVAAPRRVAARDSALPTRTVLLPNYPNPCNPATWIPFALAEPADVQVALYDLAGNRIRTLDLGRLPAGTYTAPGRAAYWDGRNDLGETVASGVYVVTIEAGPFRASRRLIVSR